MLRSENLFMAVQTSSISMNTTRNFQPLL